MRRSTAAALAAAGMLMLGGLNGDPVSAGPPSWEPIEPLPQGMGNMACGTVDNQLVAAGGITWRKGGKVWLDGIWALPAEGAVWKRIGTLPGPNAYAASGVIDSKLVLSGGSDGKSVWPDLIRIGEDGQVSRKRGLPKPALYAASAVLGGRLYEIGGALDAVDTGSLTRRARTVDPDSGRVEELPSYPGGPVMLAAAAAAGGRIYVFGGMRYDSGGRIRNLNMAFAFSPKTGRWSPVSDYPLRARGLSACTLDDQHILVAGGYADTFVRHAFIYNTRKGTYTKTLPLPVAAMTQLVQSGGYLYLLGGEDRMKHRSARCWRIRWKALIR